MISQPTSMATTSPSSHSVHAQYSVAVPCTLYGTNLDQIESINLPGADPITAYEILQSGKQSKISIQVPAEKCEPGQIVLKTKKGGEITSVSPITYREDIEITKFFVGRRKGIYR